MGTLWFIVAVIFLILWLRGRGSSADVDGDPYRRGYYDGIAARDEQLRQIALDGEYVAANQNTSNVTPVVESQAQTSPLEWQKPEVSAEEIAAEKERTSLRNMNTLLYFASFLLVAAAAAFIATSTPPVVRLVGLIAVVIALYGGGLALYKKVPRLKPAATAFVGTGLAVLPFIGVALHVLSDVPGQIAWLVISIVGVVAYYGAAIVLRSQAVSYLTIAFLLSMVSASVSAASLPMLWYFIALIVVSLAATGISLATSKSVPELFREPIERTGQIVTPVVLIASLFVASHVSIFEYQIIFALAAVQYLVTWLQQPTYRTETFVRVLAHITLLLVSWDVAGVNQALFGYLMSLTFVLQAAYSLARIHRNNAEHRTHESAWIVTTLAGLQVSALAWVGTEHAAILSVGTYAMSGVLAVGAAYYLRNARWGYVTLAMSIALILMATRSVPEQPIEWQWIALLMGVLAAVSLFVIWRIQQRQRDGHIREVMIVSASVYLAVMTVCASSSESLVAFGEALLALTAGMVVLSYLTKRPTVELIAVTPLMAAVAVLFGETTLADSQWYGTSVVIASALLTLAATAFYHSQRNVERRDRQLGASLAIFGLLIFGASGTIVVQQVHVVLLLIVTLAAIGSRIALSKASMRLQAMMSGSYVVYVALAWTLALSLDSLWMALVCAVAMSVFWLASFVEKQPLAMLAGNVAAVGAIVALWNGLGLSGDWKTFGVGWIGAAILYVTYWLLVERGDKERSKLQLYSMWGLLVATLILAGGVWITPQVVAWSLTLLFMAATVGVFGAMTKRQLAVEIAIYLATFGVQRLVEIALPELNFVLYAHWWAITIALIALWRTSYRTPRLIVAAALVTLSSGIAALDMGGWYQTLFLVEHVGLLLIGALRSLRWALWWGIVTSSLAVLYFLRDYTYLWLAFLGSLLIGIVIWRLLKQK